MSKLKDFISRIRLVKVRSRKLTVVALVVATVFATVALILLQLSIGWLSNRTRDLQEQAVHLELENAALQEDIDQVGSIQSIIEIAEKELGLVQPDAVFYEAEP